METCNSISVHIRRGDYLKTDLYMSSTIAERWLYPSFTVHRAYSSDSSWIEFATDINNVMYAYIDRKKKLPVTTLLRAIGFENDKDILEIFNLAEDVKVNKTNLKKMVGRKLAARVLKTWIEDFVDEDTGEVVSIERNEVVIDRETVIEPEHVDIILESGVQNILVHKEEPNQSDYSIIYNTLQKDPSNSEKSCTLHLPPVA